MSQSLSVKSTLPLRDLPIQIPQLGFGVYLSPAEKCKASCLAALRAGYRHIDSAQYYRNEKQVGEAVRESGIPRNEIFVTTKILAAGGSPEASYKKCLNSVETIDPGDDGYVDLFLIHSPHSGLNKVKEMWQALEKLHQEGKVKAIGVSNFGGGHIDAMKSFATVWPPHVNQIELHPWCQHDEVVDYCKAKGIVVEAYSPLARMIWQHNETVVSIAKAHDKNAAQIMIRYALQKDWVPLPKSDTEERIKSNADVFDFQLSKDEMGQLDDLQNAKDARAVVESVTWGWS